MDPSKLLGNLQSKFDVQFTDLRSLLKSSLTSHTEQIHNTLHNHLLDVDTKVANLKLHTPTSSQGFSGAASRTLKLSVPRFDGSNPIDWIFQIEAFFAFHDTPDTARLQIVLFHLEGCAAAWFQWAMRHNLLPFWSVFLEAVRDRFSPTAYEDVEGDLSKLTQRFFITGLKRNLRQELQFHRPPTLMAAFAMTRAYEARLDDNPTHVKSWSHGSSSASSPIFLNPTPASTHNPSTQTQHRALNPYTSLTQKTTPQPALLPTPNSTSLVHLISPAEIRDRRAKGLCFKCDEKLGPSHRCKSNVMLLLGSEDDEPEPETEDHPPDEVSGDISSLHVLSSQLQGRSLRVTDLYKQHKFPILIDSDNTHNFIKPALVEQLGISVTPCHVFA
ncbi:hypothetical protein KIW84_010199 [Lathyrus oleraceus]|uniref:Retrotransposon gag domain-containing protein n=1 Tax=Pisum sativum TaxID=3888 RepID=A0A9D4YJ76_PEA|nr:hypothetical protein KIW84_010199 [Pisum sativum]